MDRRIVNCPTGVIASDLPTGYVWANWIDTLRTVVNGGSWPASAPFGGAPTQLPSDLRLLSNLQRVVYLDSQIPDRALQLGVAQ
jgi:hypothetical protein